MGRGHKQTTAKGEKNPTISIEKKRGEGNTQHKSQKRDKHSVPNIAS